MLFVFIFVIVICQMELGFVFVMMGMCIVLFYLVQELLQLCMFLNFRRCLSMNQVWFECLLIWQYVIMLLLFWSLVLLWQMVLSLVWVLKLLFLVMVFVYGMFCVVGMCLVCSVFFLGYVGVVVCFLLYFLGECMLIRGLLMCVSIFFLQVWMVVLLCLMIGYLVVGWFVGLWVSLWFLVIQWLWLLFRRWMFL